MANLALYGRQWARTRPDRLAVRCRDVDRTWGALDTNSDELARGFIERGVGPGDRVGVLLSNCVEIVEIVLATLKVGAIAVPLNVMLKPAELTPLVVDAGCRLIVTEAALADRLRDVPASLPGVALFGRLPEDGLEPMARLRIAGRQFPIVDRDARDASFICYTSGTTGVQKGAVLTHDSLRIGGLTKVLSEGLTFADRFLVPVQLVYTGAIVAVFMQLVHLTGAAMVLEPEFDVERCLELIERERITTMSGVPVVYERMASSSSFDRRDISSLRSLSAGGSPVSKELLETFQARGIPMIQSYGMTECSGYATALDFANAFDHLGSVGLPVIGSEIEIRDDDGAPVPTDTVGEITIRGSHVMEGYWNRPELTAETIRGGWLHSGDLGQMSDDGFLTIVDRKKDMLISGGHNVYPAEIENALATVDGLDELAVIAVHDDRWGEVPMLLCRSARPIDDIVGDVLAVCSRDLAGYKRPKYVVSLPDPLPRTFAGKVSKSVLRTQFPVAPPDAVDVGR